MAIEDEAVYLSRVESRTWDRDEEVGGFAHMLFDHDRTKVGLWKAQAGDAVGLVEVGIPARETILVLAGTVRIAIDRDEPYDLRVGDMLSIPEGSLVGWDAAPDCTVLWIYT